MDYPSQKNLAITHWAEEDRPREKLLLKGVAALSDAELIAILIGSGTTELSAVDLSKLILHSVGNQLHQLARLSVKDLTKFKGIGEAKAISIVSALELGRRRKESEPLKKAKITCSADAYELIKPHLWDQKREEFWVLLLDRANQVLKKQQISQGGINGTIADPRLIFQVALQEFATGIILVHNHPSGQLKPSEADRKLTKKIKEGGQLLDIQLLDHLIFTDESYYSFSDEGDL
ncbi:DNA repair protein RadC [Cytophagales bacterium LB-30]|uniref:DNA repair protein RadC n=1 Tax=Shiella aurantiaca TaxID=3058365 RepID=A0ABT8F319_9BACT|nr:DNA repair protein RadC [Shiella aurantiaca]MDN4164848.1 DNA repair protein RadC [Shiella aurantiaca]